jgi:hypothetical protein
LETRKVLSHAKCHQAAANEQPAGDRFGMMFTSIPGPTHHLRSDLGVGEVAIGLALGKYVPKDDRQAPGDGDDRLARDEALGKAIEFAFPIGVKIHGGPGGLDQGGAKIAAAGFGDATLGEGRSPVAQSFPLKKQERAGMLRGGRREGSGFRPGHSLVCSSAAELV